jgi:hypothetical protein
VSEATTRRAWLRTAGMALVAIPAWSITRRAAASTNAELRARLEYQGSPKDSLRCSACLEFVPGKDEHAPGGCKVIPGDDEISPDGWCTAWNTL